MFYFKTVKLGFDPEFLGRAHLVAAIADLAGECRVTPPADGARYCG
jgi:hypothetical protein